MLQDVLTIAIEIAIIIVPNCAYNTAVVVVILYAKANVLVQQVNTMEKKISRP